MLWELARQHLGKDYRREIRLRLPPYLKLVLTNRFPRTQVTTQIGRRAAVYFGPFRNRATAPHFESEFLDFSSCGAARTTWCPAPITLAACMAKWAGVCGPARQAVGVEEYRGEAMRVADFLRTGGQSLLDPALAARDRLSAEMDFEGAAMMHQRLQPIEQVLALNDEMARDVNRLDAVAIAPSAEPECVELGWLRGGYWQGFTRLDFRIADGQIRIARCAFARSRCRRTGARRGTDRADGATGDPLAMVLFDLARRRNAADRRLVQDPVAQAGQCGVAGRNVATLTPRPNTRS